MDMTERKCEICKREFYPAAHNKLCCSPECAQTRHAAQKAEWDKHRTDRRAATRRAREHVVKREVESRHAEVCDIPPALVAALELAHKGDHSLLERRLHECCRS